MKNHMARLSGIVALAALCLAACAPGAATPPANLNQSPPATLAATETVSSAPQAAEIELTGMIESMAPDVWILNGQVLAILPATELKGSFQVGDLVKAHAAAQADGSLAATQIEPVAGASDSIGSVAEAEYYFTGAVDAIATDQWTVNGTTFGVTPQTEIKGTFNIGELVKVHVLTGSDGALVAREIEAPEAALAAAGPGTEVEFVGLVDSISADVWVVDGQTLAITPETEIKGTFVVGDSVKVHVLVGADGSHTAREIEAAAVGQVSDDGSGDDNSNSNSNTNVNDDNGGNSNGGNDNGGGGGGGGGGNDNGGGGNNNGG